MFGRDGTDTTLLAAAITNILVADGHREEFQEPLCRGVADTTVVVVIVAANRVGLAPWMTVRPL
jgi:hypothetical protein